MSHKTSRNRQRQVECAGEHFLRERMNCVNTVRAVKTRFQRQDLFACDVLGKTERGYLVGLQVTCGDHRNVGHRRRKLEGVSWSANDTVLIGEFRSEGRQRWFRMHELDGGEWRVWEIPVDVPRTWFKAWKKAE